MPSAGWELPQKPYQGKALITSLELNASDGDKATFSVSLDGTGVLTNGDSSAGGDGGDGGGGSDGDQGENPLG